MNYNTLQQLMCYQKNKLKIPLGNTVLFLKTNMTENTQNKYDQKKKDCLFGDFTTIEYDSSHSEK